MAALDAQTPSLHGHPPEAFPVYGEGYGQTKGNGATHFYDPNGAEPLFTFGGLPGVTGPSAPAFRWRHRLTIY
jgi:hypothetical protein